MDTIAIVSPSSLITRRYPACPRPAAQCVWPSPDHSGQFLHTRPLLQVTKPVRPALQRRRQFVRSQSRVVRQHACRTGFASAATRSRNRAARCSSRVRKRPTSSARCWKVLPRAGLRARSMSTIIWTDIRGSIPAGAAHVCPLAAGG